MTKLHRAACCMCLLPVLSWAQATPSSLNPDQIRFFVGFFQRMGDPGLTSDMMHNHEVAIRSIYRLNEAEIDLLASANETYRSGMATLRVTELGIVAGKPSLADADRAAIAQLVQNRDQMVSALASSFLQGVRPIISARLLADAQRVAQNASRKAN